MVKHLLEVKNLSIGIKKDGRLLKAVNQINFNVNEGEILGIAGESGCGKTLTALSILDLLPEAAKITNGEIIFENRLLTKQEISGIRGREISMIFQEVRQALNPMIRMGRQITEMLELGGCMDKIQNKTKVLEMLTSLGFENTEKIFNAYPHQLSGGMCQRVLAAIAAIGSPRLLLADEPSSSLDKESQNLILSMLTKMNRDKKTSVLIISHDLSIIRQFCTRFLVMYAGRIIEEGPSAGFSSPLHPYTKALSMAIPDKTKRGKKLSSLPGKVPSIEDNLTGCPFAPRCRKAQSICFLDFPPIIESGSQKAYCYFPLKGNEENDD